ncbi:MAG: CPBP family intramembrane metalloprotease [Prevotella sp.]|nr:CPBP family intramembrane metalloprotease [Prevotella sp.]
MLKAISYTLIFAGIQMLVSALAMLLVPLIGDGSWAGSPYVLVVSMAVFSLVSIVVFLWAGWAQVSREYLQSRPWAVLFWCVIAAIGVVVPSMALQEQMPELPNIVEEQLAEIMNTHGGYFVIALLAPLAEELVFRGAVLRSLLTWRPESRWRMVFVSAVLFALIHMNPAQMPHAFLMGFLLGLLYERTGSIVPGVAFHWTNNTLAFVLFKLYPDPSIRLIDILGSGRNVGAAVIFSLFILLPALYQLWLRTERAS